MDKGRLHLIYEWENWYLEVIDFNRREQGHSFFDKLNQENIYELIKIRNMYPNEIVYPEIQDLFERLPIKIDEIHLP